MYSRNWREYASFASYSPVLFDTLSIAIFIIAPSVLWPR